MQVIGLLLIKAYKQQIKHSAEEMKMLRIPEKITPAEPTTDGDGVDLKRTRLFDGRLDPFLMLDEIKANPDESPNAFPVHPHRGIQTLTYLIHGKMAHQDSMGNQSEILAGSLQWMHTGKGIEHSEKPSVDAQGLWGFQFWLNVPREEKFQPPQYQDISSKDILQMNLDGVEVKLLAGCLRLNDQPYRSTFQKLSGKASLVDLNWQYRQLVKIETDAANAGMFVIANEVFVVKPSGDFQKIPAGQFVSFSSGNQVQLHADDGARVLFFAGEPIAEPIVHQGPFVMTSEAEIRETIQAYREGTLVASE